jgi:hypothetical protein
VAELKEQEEHAKLKYMELRSLANTAWRVDHPVDSSKPPRKPRKDSKVATSSESDSESEPKTDSESDSEVAAAKPEAKKAKKTKVAKEPKAEKEKEKVKRPLNAYQLFINAKVVELKELEEHASLKYMELRSLANTMWRVDNPVDPSKPPRKPREKKVKEPKALKVEKPKRAPSAYNLFISAAIHDLKAKHANDAEKLDHKELMKLAAKQWNEFKASEEEEDDENDEDDEE